MVNCKYVMPDHKCLDEENIKLIQSITAERDRYKKGLEDINLIAYPCYSCGKTDLDRNCAECFEDRLKAIRINCKQALEENNGD